MNRLPIPGPIPGLALAALTLIADQAVKLWVMGPLALPLVGQVRVLPIFNFTWAENRGISLGLLNGDSGAQRWLLVALTGAISLGVLFWMSREKQRGDVLALGLVLGGALGNIIDRVRLGFVADYADLHFGELRPFFIFNLADAAISIGVLIILARSVLSREKRAEPPAQGATES